MAVLPGRSGQGTRRRPGALRRGLRALVRASSRRPPPPLRVRREPRLLRRRERLQRRVRPGNRTSGALFVGPPNFNPSYREFVDQRDVGSPEVEPVYRDGRTVRFSNRPAAGIPPSSIAWPGTRVLSLQHPSDPITWWSPDLVLHRPDWLAEPRGDDVLGASRWIPVVTFWQVSADLALGFSTPPGHGHNDSGEHVAAWAAVLRTRGWTPDEYDRLRRMLARG